MEPILVLCIDDDPSVHDTFARVLCPTQSSETTALDSLPSEVLGLTSEQERRSLQPSSTARDGAPRTDFVRLTHATSGEGGIELFEAARSTGRTFDVAIVDMRMPLGIDGLQTMRRLRALSPDLQLILCTGYTDYNFRELNAAASGAESFLILKKPFDSLELRQMVLSLGEKRRLAAEHAILEAELRRTQKLELIGRFAGGVAHDFNNLLTVIGGEAELLGSEDMPLEESRRLILEATAHGSELTRRLLLFSREKSPERKLVDLSHLVEDGLRLFRRLIPENVRTELSFQSKSHVWASPTELTRVLMNLVVNATDAMPNGGTLRVTTRDLTSVPGVGVSGFAANACLSVEDTGTGISESALAHLFDSFMNSKAEGKGSSLGLSFVKTTIEGLGGSIEVSSELGNGTRFDIILPVRTGTSLDRPEPGPGIGGSGELILLAEDNHQLRDLTERTLRRHGYAVLSFADPKDALDVDDATLRRTSLLLSDVLMPNLTGPELYLELAKRRFDLPVLFVSGYLNENEIEGRFSTHFMRKPWRREALLEAIAARVPRPLAH